MYIPSQLKRMKILSVYNWVERKEIIFCTLFSNFS